MFGGTITVANTGTTNLVGALEFEVTGLPAGVILANASGIAPDGKPYIFINLANGVLAPGQSITFTVLFKNPSLLSFTYGVLVFDEIAKRASVIQGEELLCPAPPCLYCCRRAVAVGCSRARARASRPDLQRQR